MASKFLIANCRVPLSSLLAVGAGRFLNIAAVPTAGQAGQWHPTKLMASKLVVALVILAATSAQGAHD